MRKELFFFAWFMMCGIPLLSSAVPIVGRFLVQSAFAKIVLFAAAILCGFTVLMTVAYFKEMTALKVFYTAAGVAPLHHILLLRHLYKRFFKNHGRNPRATSRFSPQADREFASNNMLLGAFPYFVIALIISYLAKHGY